MTPILLQTLQQVESNSNGNQIDSNGNQIDSDGNQIDNNGNQIDSNGNQIDSNGNLIDSNGNLIRPSPQYNRPSLHKIIKQVIYTNNQTAILISWLNQHYDHPYPTQNEKRQLMDLTGLSYGQLNRWFTANRIRVTIRPPQNNLFNFNKLITS